MEKLFQFSFSLLTEADTRKSTGNEEKPHKPRERKKFLSYQQQYNKHKLFDEIYKNLLTFFSRKLFIDVAMLIETMARVAN